MAGMPTTDRDKLMAFVGVIGIIGAIAYYLYPYSTKAEEIAGIRTHLEALDRSNATAKAISQRGTVAQLQEEAQRMRANLDLMRTLIPTGNEVPALLEQMLGAARRTGLEIEGFTPGATVEGETFDTMKYRLVAQGDYHQIGELLTAVGSLRRIVVPINVALTPSGAARARTMPSNEALLHLTFEIQTYVAKAAPAAEGDK